MRKAIFGGTFDPIHNGHMNIAYEALYNLNLDKVIFIPSGNPPHKNPKKVTEAKFRYDMVNAVIKNEKKFEISSYEIENNDISYTYKTLQHFNEIEPYTKWFFITGADSLIQLESWSNVKEILKYSTLIVFSRPGYTVKEIENQKNYIEEKYNTNIIFLDVPLIEISSTSIKRKLQENKNVTYLLPYEAYKIIQKYNLYINKGSESMTKEDKIKEYLKNNLKTSRYNHTLGVVETAEKLAKRYNSNIEKARIAALLHDCAKNMSSEQLLKIAKENNCEIDNIISSSPQLLHGFVGSVLAKSLFDINDDEILNAIRFHTTGKKDMTLLEKIIYVADYIEPTRSFNGIEDVRKMAFEDLNKSLLYCYDNTIKYILSKKLLLHPNTIEARNFLLINT